MLHGRIRRVVPEHGFGFIVDDTGLDWFFVEAGLRDVPLGALRPKDHIVFAPEWTSGGPRAKDIAISGVRYVE